MKKIKSKNLHTEQRGLLAMLRPLDSVELKASSKMIPFLGSRRVRTAQPLLPCVRLLQVLARASFLSSVLHH